MKLIAHRKNTRAELAATDPQYGVEIDIRTQGNDLILQHDPFLPGERFKDWLHDYKHGTLILNVKEEGLESHILRLPEAHGITDYFFLDQSFPFLIQWAKRGEYRCAVRFSEFESIHTVLKLAGKIQWVWVDCFTEFPLTAQDFQTLTTHGFSICLVSPELQGRPAVIEIPKLVQHLKELHIQPDGVCTKRPDLWENILPILENADFVDPRSSNCGQAEQGLCRGAYTEVRNEAKLRSANPEFEIRRV